MVVRQVGPALLCMASLGSRGAMQWLAVGRQVRLPLLFAASYMYRDDSLHSVFSDVSY